ncbi:LegC family aminotransferase [Mixta tenebrionis]|uniref:LegC family aminotransferase n=1 Tax=Mixta tenebrionis TaxID=2562439 RepID=A0A506VA13_9GAMM|nr:LegC family aminotransferase [Mixta tenebrionis]TPW42711.1 LegC family aminotransferase [Mixta tenebrionis]
MNAEHIINFIRETFNSNAFIPLHAPTFSGSEKKYVMDTLDSTFVSSVGKYVDSFEEKVQSYTGSARAVATVNGTAALNAALYLADVQRGDLVITQALTFIATCNALHHLGAEPVFIDVSPTSLGLCPLALDKWLNENAKLNENGCFHKSTKQRIRAVVPMHTFGHPVQLDEIVTLCEKWKIILIEDAAESLGSRYKGQHTGTFGSYGVLSFNGNKIITTGGGGVILCQDKELGKRAKHITTTAKIPHPYEFYHDEPGFNYRMPNINAALGCAQLERIDDFLSKKRNLAKHYELFFENSCFKFFKEAEYAESNYWLNAIICEEPKMRDELLIKLNKAEIMARPVWKLMHRLPMYSKALRDDLKYSEYIESRLVNLPSSPIF